MKSVFHNEGGDIEFTPSGIRVIGKLGMDHTIFGSAFEFVRDHVTTGTPKLTIPAPSLVHYRGGPAAIDPSVYPDIAEFWEDLGAAYADEVPRLGALGCTYLQLDDTSLAYLNDPAQRAEFTRRGEDADHQHEVYIKSINRALRGQPADGGHHAPVPGQLPLLLGRLGRLRLRRRRAVQPAERGRLLHGVRRRPLRRVRAAALRAQGQVRGAGAGHLKRGELEAKDDIKRRIDEAAKYVDLDQLCLSPQCGFSSTLDGNALTREQQIAKLRLVVEVAEEVWGTQ